MGYDVLIDLGKDALKQAVGYVEKAFTKPYKRVIELRNETDHKLELVTGYPTRFEFAATSEFVNGPDATVDPKSIEVFGVQGTRNLLGPTAINGWCTYTCPKFDLMITYTVLNDMLGLAGQKIGVWLQPSKTITESLAITSYGVKYDNSSVQDSGKDYGVKVTGTSGDEIFEFTLSRL